MKREEEIRIATSLRTDFKCESDIIVDFCNTIIKALEKEPILDELQSERDRLQRIVDSINESDLVQITLDAIEDDIEEKKENNGFTDYVDDVFSYLTGLDDALEIIEKYRERRD